jgi:hypothetical protein
MVNCYPVFGPFRFDPVRTIHCMVGAVSVTTSYREPAVSFSFVGAKEKFRCGIETARKTLKAITHRSVWQVRHPLHNIIKWIN